MKATIKFYGHNAEVEKNNYVTLELKLDENNRYIFSCSGGMRGTGGQCLDEIKKYNHSKLFAEIYRWWKNYHLNDMHSGTPAQEKAIKHYFKEKNMRYNYDTACEYLQSIDLLIDKNYTTEKFPEGYRYGHDWLYQEIPEDDLNKIKAIIEIYN